LQDFNVGGISAQQDNATATADDCTNGRNPTEGKHQVIFIMQNNHLLLTVDCSDSKNKRKIPCCQVCPLFGLCRKSTRLLLSARCDL